MDAKKIGILREGIRFWLGQQIAYDENTFPWFIKNQELIDQLQAENEAKNKALLSAQQLMEWAESKCHLNCSDGYVPMMPHGDPEPCGWCLTKGLIEQSLKGE